jgi:hypothetical protein
MFQPWRVKDLNIPAKTIDESVKLGLLFDILTHGENRTIRDNHYSRQQVEHGHSASFNIRHWHAWA